VSRTVAVTGAASGIGRATAERLRRAGDRVVSVDLRDADVVADLSTPAGRAAAAEGVLAAAPTLDAVICCAGVEEKSDLTVRVNYFGVVELLEALRSRLAESPAPRAVAVASFAAIYPAVDETVVEACLAGDEPAALAACAEALAAEPPRSVYVSSKRALIRWVRRAAIRPEWAGAGIPLNAVAPGIVATPMVQYRLDDPGRREALARAVPMPLHGPGEPDHVASLLVWLASPENVLVTGQVIFVDGGADATLRGDDIW
jgi:NAD(P)-dependent dehydrogenase (short-subunit alcohol dehydrogenase family)